MGSCCQNKSCELTALRERQAGTLKAVLLVNAVMFVVEMVAGLMAASTALLADSLDMLGDALVYGFSLYVIGMGALWRARAAYFKGLIMLVFGLGVAAEVAWKLWHPAVPDAPTIGAIGLLALTMNALCLFLLTRHRHDDINMRSVWLCSRNDIFANVSVLIAGATVAATHSQWPDLLVGSAIAALFLHSSVEVLRDSRREMRGAA